ncbi:MAG: hypothetical protein MUE41_05545 [Gemmatimonadaceae bacterium]|jgi:hypothetical protein|nr:hypothetical protein [Gemmatimonadaceae bacterium]
MAWFRLVLALAARAIVNPFLAMDLLRMAWRFRAIDWYRRPPFLPLPPAEYVEWRLYTAYGDGHAVPPVDDVIAYARWAARQR